MQLNVIRAVLMTVARSSKWITLILFGVVSLNVVAATLPLAKLSNGETVTEDDFNAYLARRADLKPIARNVSGAESALREMVMTRVLVLEGLAMNQPNRGGANPERFDDAYGHMVYQKLVKVCPKVEGSAVREFYDKHPEAFTVPASARLARVMLPVSEKIDGHPPMTWLMDRAQEIAKGSGNFEKIATRAQEIYRLEVQGDLGWVNLTGDVSIMKALAGARPGELVGPVRDGDFAYLFLVGDKRESRTMKWDEVKTSASNRQVVYCREQASGELTDKLFRKHGVSIDSTAIKALFKMPVRVTPLAPEESKAKK